MLCIAQKIRYVPLPYAVYASEPQITKFEQISPVNFKLDWQAPHDIALGHAGPANLAAVAVKEDGTEISLGMHSGNTGQSTGATFIDNINGATFRARVKVAAAPDSQAGAGMGPFSAPTELFTFGRLLALDSSALLIGIIWQASKCCRAALQSIY